MCYRYCLYILILHSMHFNVLCSSLQVIDRVNGFHLKRCHSQLTPPNSSPPSTHNSSPPNTPNRTPLKGDLDDTISPLPPPMPPLKPAYMDTPSNSPNLGAKKRMLQYKQLRAKCPLILLLSSTSLSLHQERSSNHPRPGFKITSIRFQFLQRTGFFRPQHGYSNDIIEAAQALI